GLTGGVHGAAVAVIAGAALGERRRHAFRPCLVARDVEARHLRRVLARRGAIVALTGGVTGLSGRTEQPIVACAADVDRGGVARACPVARAGRAGGVPAGLSGRGWARDAA